MTESSPTAVCQPPADETEQACSVYEHARREAEKHKWLESEKSGRDLGDQAIEDWYRQFWHDYCRSRRLEHLAGEQQWAEFASDEFGRMYELLVSGDELLEDLLARFGRGWENLCFAKWMHECNMPRPKIERILELLEIININLTRLDRRQHAE